MGTLDAISFAIYFKISEATEMPRQQGLIWPLGVGAVGCDTQHFFFSISETEMYPPTKKKNNNNALRGVFG